jgi:hypothetical protein
VHLPPETRDHNAAMRLHFDDIAVIRRKVLVASRDS